MDFSSLEFANISEFDALAQSIAARLGCQASLIGVIRCDAVFVLGYSGQPTDLQQRSFPVRETICDRTIHAGQPVRIADVQSDARLRAMPMVAAMNIGAYMGVPIKVGDGRVVGSVCALSTSPRIWQNSELNYLAAVADLAESKLERQRLDMEQKALCAALAENDAILSTLSHMHGKAITIHNAQGDLVFVNSAMNTDLHLSNQDMLALPRVARQLRQAGSQSGAFPVVLPVPTQTELNVQVSAVDNGLMLAEWSRAPIE